MTGSQFLRGGSLLAACKSLWSDHRPVVNTVEVLRRCKPVDAWLRRQAGTFGFVASAILSRVLKN